jgi:integrase
LAVRYQLAAVAAGLPSGLGRLLARTDWHNWRKRIYKPTAEAVGISGAGPYDLRHAFASSLIHDGRKSIVEIAEQLGHNPTVCLNTYGHVMRELAGGERVSAEEQIVLARDALGHEQGAQLSLM